MVQDSGTNSHDIHIVRGGGTKPNRHWDTVSTIAQAWLEANPGSRKSQVQVMRDIIRMNNLKDGDGRDCLGREHRAGQDRG